jgi:hypothetical protein
MNGKTLLAVALANRAQGWDTLAVLDAQGNLVTVGKLTGTDPGPYPRGGSPVEQADWCSSFAGNDFAVVQTGQGTASAPVQAVIAAAAGGPLKPAGLYAEQTITWISSTWATANGLDVSYESPYGDGSGIPSTTLMNDQAAMFLLAFCRPLAASVVGHPIGETSASELAKILPQVDWRIAGGTATGLTLAQWTTAHEVAGNYISPYFDMKTGQRLPSVAAPAPGAPTSSATPPAQLPAPSQQATSVASAAAIVLGAAAGDFALATHPSGVAGNLRTIIIPYLMEKIG